MVEFIMHSPIRRAVLLAAAHGMTDVAAPDLLFPYVVLGLPLPGWLTTALFSAASVVHFASDMGLAMSAAMHVALTAMATRNADASFFLMSVYFCFVHTPLHYLRLLMDGSRGVAAVSIALAITLSMLAISAVPAWSARAARLLPPGARLLTPFGDGSGAIQITHLMQRLVFAHVCVETLKGVRRGQPWLPPTAPPWQSPWFSSVPSLAVRD